jgi:hypothetical protein
MTIETEVTLLTTATTALIESVNSPKVALDTKYAAVADAATTSAQRVIANQAEAVAVPAATAAGLSATTAIATINPTVSTRTSSAASLTAAASKVCITDGTGTLDDSWLSAFTEVVQPDIYPALNLDFTNSETLDPRIAFTRASIATRVNKFGLLETVPAGAARIEYDPVTLVCKGLLIEEARTNLALQSNAFLTAPWTGFATITGNFTNVANQLTGLTDAWQVVEMAVTGQRIQRTDVTTTNTLTHTISVYVKALPGSLQRYVALRMGDATNIASANATAIFNPNTGAVVLAGTNTGVTTGAATTVQDCGNGWYRISLSCVPYTSGTSLRVQVNLTDVTNNPVPSYAGDANSGVLLYGFQCEAAAFPSSYIPTTTIAVLRAADFPQTIGANFTSWYNQAEGTIVCNAVNQFVTGAAAKSMWIVTDASLQNRNAPQISTTGKPVVYINSGGVAQVNGIGSTYNTLVSNTPFKTAVAYKVNDFATSTDGQTPITDTLGSVPVNPDRMNIGMISTINTVFNGHISRITYYNKRLTDAQLVELTKA